MNDGHADAGRPDDGLRVTRAVTVPSAELVWRFSRSSGPGGQSVNTTDSRVELLFDVAGTAALPPELKARALERLAGRLVDGVIAVTAQEHRSQYQNRRAAMARLGALLAAAVAPPPRARRPTRPSRGAVERRLEGKRRRGQTKHGRRTPEE
ncbi:MAG TPA: alternative ribosome rescue aminoacyl-tRNA hydrolase ArfB [Micromonosporaceae bacterium]|nr:alternative ribosome rescue aminoacyl-tRNA hydrolase ArfB [Micromonosporaceae bacterium]